MKKEKQTKIKEKLDKLQEKFNIAAEAIDVLTLDEDLSDLEDSLEVHSPPPVPTQNNLPTTKDKDSVLLDEVFDFETLKKDFAMIRSNVIAIINKGQHILEECSHLDLADMKAGQLEALANLQKTLGENIKLLVSVYKDIVSVEQQKKTMLTSQINNEEENNKGGMQVNGTVNQQFIFAGNTSDLIRAFNQIEEKKVEEIKE